MPLVDQFHGFAESAEDDGVLADVVAGADRVHADLLRGTFADHPFPALRAAGCKVTLNSDDPPYFWTTLKREYDIAAEHFAMDDKALIAVTRTAIEAAFVDRKTKAMLLSRLDAKGR